MLSPQRHPVPADTALACARDGQPVHSRHPTNATAYRRDALFSYLTIRATRTRYLCSPPPRPLPGRRAAPVQCQRHRPSRGRSHTAPLTAAARAPLSRPTTAQAAPRVCRAEWCQLVLFVPRTTCVGAYCSHSYAGQRVSPFTQRHGQRLPRFELRGDRTSATPTGRQIPTQRRRLGTSGPHPRIYP